MTDRDHGAAKVLDATEAAASLKELMELGGWKSIQSVIRYAHLAPEHLSKAAGRIARNLHAETTGFHRKA